MPVQLSASVLLIGAGLWLFVLGIIIGLLYSFGESQTPEQEYDQERVLER